MHQFKYSCGKLHFLTIFRLTNNVNTPFHYSDQILDCFPNTSEIIVLGNDGMCIVHRNGSENHEHLPLETYRCIVTVGFITRFLRFRFLCSGSGSYVKVPTFNASYVLKGTTDSSIVFNLCTMFMILNLFPFIQC